MNNRTGAETVGATNLNLIRRTPVAFASQHGPAGRRTWWWVSYTCPFGCGSHFGRSRTEFKDGTRHAGCGRRIYLRVARTYHSQTTGVA